MNRRRLLAPQLELSPVWKDYADTLDKVFAEAGIDDARQKLALLRMPLNLGDVVVEDGNGALVAMSEVQRQEPLTLVKTADMLGFRFYDQTLLAPEDYLRLALFLGQYYAEDKGTERFADFMGFVANAVFESVPTWTQDYVTFYEEGDAAIGTPVYEGGTWYPTTHVVLRFSLSKFGGVPRESLIEFFHYFANINVVLWAIDMVEDGYIGVKIAGAATTEIFY